MSLLGTIRLDWFTLYGKTRRLPVHENNTVAFLHGCPIRLSYSRRCFYPLPRDVHQIPSGNFGMLSYCFPVSNVYVKRLPWAGRDR